MNILRTLFLLIALFPQNLRASSASELRGFVLTINPTTGEELLIEDPLFLRKKKFPPGSLIKLFTLLTGLKRGEVNPQKVIYCGGSSPDEPVFKACWYRGGHGFLNLTQALAHSCNRYFIEIAREIDYLAFLDLLMEFGLIEEKDDFLHLSYEERLKLMVGLSPLLKLRPIDLLYAIAAIFNGGYLFSEEGMKKRIDLPKEAVEILYKGMEESAVYGTSNEAHSIVGIRKIIAKTGTSPHLSDFTKTYAWFVGFYPSHQPKVGTLVFLLEGTGSKDAAKVGGEVLKELLREEIAPKKEATYNCYIAGWVISLKEAGDDLKNTELVNELNPFGEWEIFPDGEIRFRWGILPHQIPRSFHILLIPTFRATATEFNRLRGPKAKARLVQNIIFHLMGEKVEGIDLNIESDWKEKTSVNKDVFISFLKRLRSAFDEISNSYKISIGVERYMIYNWDKEVWKVIDQLVDEYRLILYDYNKTALKPSSPAPLPRIKEDTKKFLQILPKPEKTLLGVPTHGFLWSMDQDGKWTYRGPIWYEKPLSLSKSSRVPVIGYLDRACAKWDENSKVHYLSFQKDGSHFQIWYEDAKSLRYKLEEVVEEMGLKGVALWRFGMEDKSIWSILRKVADPKYFGNSNKNYKEY